MKTLSRYHDARFVALDLNQSPRRIVVVFQTEDARRLTIECEGCVLFRMTDVATQNIVSRVVVAGGPLLDEGWVSERMAWATGIEGSGSYLSESFRAVTLDKMRRGQLSLLWVDPSCGAESVVVFEQYIESGPG